ncbi:X-domain of DnaJ-containing [Ceratobasidium sp. AG-Ba]|nr:X-domain of DnaJ-containing [Ceratobasidium sp. AG-Ba]
MSDYGVLPSRAQVPHVPLTCTQCSTPIEFLAPSPPPPPNTALRIRCYKCSSIITHRVGAAQIQAGPSYNGTPPKSSTPQPQQRKRKIGTQERPLETAYYEILGVEVTATTEDIKKAYRRLAIKHHPDKNRDDPSAEETFKQISIAYQVLSDPELRKKYNEFGPKEGTPDAGFVDPEEIFGAIFGGDRFVPIIGHISLGKDMKDALQNEESDNEEPEAPVLRDAKGREIITPEERARREAKRRRKEERDRQVDAAKAKARAERVAQLVTELSRKLSIYTESATGSPYQDADVASSWKQICEIEAEELKSESYGVELLHAIGFVYTAKAKHYLATNQTFMGVGGWLHNIQGKYHVFSETVSTVRSALELKQVFDQIAEAEKAGVSPEEKKKLEEQAAEKGLRALFKGAKLEIESVLREVCDRVLSDPSLQSSKLHLRAEGLQILGEAYLSVRKNEDGGAEDEFKRESLWRPPQERAVYGGQLIAHSIMAAARCVGAGFSVNSVHCHFLLGADPSLPITYSVESMREGKTYSTMMVKGKQNERWVVSVVCSFQRPEFNQPSHSHRMPRNVPPPESYSKLEDTYLALGANPILARKGFPIEVKMAGAYPTVDGLTEDVFWMRFKTTPSQEASFKKCALAFLSDFYILSTVARALGIARHALPPNRLAMASSLDHSVWFYDDDFDMTEWLMFVMVSPAGGMGRGIVNGRIYTRSGRLIAVVTQEGVVRTESGRTQKAIAKL